MALLASDGSPSLDARTDHGGNTAPVSALKTHCTGLGGGCLPVAVRRASRVSWAQAVPSKKPEVFIVVVVIFYIKGAMIYFLSVRALENLCESQFSK